MNKKIALIAHDKKKDDLVEVVKIFLEIMNL